MIILPLIEHRCSTHTLTTVSPNYGALADSAYACTDMKCWKVCASEQATEKTRRATNNRPNDRRNAQQRLLRQKWTSPILSSRTNCCWIFDIFYITTNMSNALLHFNGAFSLPWIFLLQANISFI